MDEAEFAAKYGHNPVTIYICVPSDPANSAWCLNGQTISFETPVLATGKDIKDRLSALLGGMPANKMQIRVRERTDLGFLKDTQTLATLNIGHGAYLDMTLRSRGGKK